MNIHRLIPCVIALACLAAVAAEPEPKTLDEAFAALKTYKVGQSRAGLDLITAEVLKAHGDARARAAIAQRLAAVLATDATFEAKDFVCRQLYVGGTPAEIPAVAKLLEDEKLSHMARYVLEAMADPRADGAMRDALAGARGPALIGLVNSLGNRRDAASAPAMIKLLDSPEPGVGPAAACALGKIGGAEAVAALSRRTNAENVALRNAAVDGLLIAGDALLAAGKKAEAASICSALRSPDQPARVQVAALRGLVQADPGAAVPVLIGLLKGDDAAMRPMAVAMLGEVPGAAVGEALVSAMPSLPAPTQAMLLGVLARRGDSASRSAILKAMTHTDPVIRTAAIQAMETTGTAAEVPALVELAAKGGSEADAARSTLARLPDAGADAALVKLLEGSPVGVRVEAMKALGARQSAGAVGRLMAVAASDPEEPARLGAYEALALLAGEKEYPALVGMLVKAPTPAQRDAAANAMIAASQRMKDRGQGVAPIVEAMGGASGPTRVALLGALGRIGGEQALDAVRKAMGDGDAEVREAAIRVLCQWPDAAAVTDLFKLAADKDARHNVLAIRGIVRLVNARSGRPSGEVIKLLRSALDLAGRPEEKRQVIGALGDVKDPAAVDALTPLLADPALANEAAAAVLKIAKNAGANRPRVAAALRSVGEANVRADLKKQAQDLAGK